MKKGEKAYPRLILRRIRRYGRYIAMNKTCETPLWEVCMIKHKGGMPHTLRIGTREMMLVFIDRHLKRLAGRTQWGQL